MVETIISIVNLIVGNYQVIITTVVAVLSSLITIFMLIPGDQPEKFLQAIVDFIKKFSRK